MVGANNGLVFQPSNIQAAPGSMIEFQFTSRNHSVVQADFASPCVPIEQVSSEYAGFYSGFMPVAAGSNTMPKFTIMVPDTEPIYYYCSQGEHCQAGMVGAINAPTTGNTTAAFAAAAKQAPANVSPKGPNANSTLAVGSSSAAASTTAASGSSTGSKTGSATGSATGSSTGSSAGTATSKAASSSASAPAQQTTNAGPRGPGEFVGQGLLGAGLADDVINTVNELVFRAVNAVEEGLLNASPSSLGFDKKAADEGRIPETDGDGAESYPEARQEIEDGVQQLETLLNSTVDKNFDKLEIYVLRNVLAVPEDLTSWIRLDHYKNLDFTPQKADDPTLESIQLLRRKVQETEKLQVALQAEAVRNEALIQQLQLLISGSASTAFKTEPSSSPTKDSMSAQPSAPFAFLTSTHAAKTLGISTTTAHNPLTQNTTFALAQLPALRNLLASLRPKLTALPDAPVEDEETIAGERRAYIESQTRRHLERRGVDLNAEGSVGLGRRIGPEEVRAIEAIVGALRRDGQAGAGADAGAEAMEE
ncbi:hypothetical protein B0A49_03910 [Cryomyces minteri]|uniref:Blue (type 1) copper domain-containing protein n=2 Tax=Cryomyces minteri TaxID=331657 RepID=A0A4U0XFN3_9PEZI|nr:hypothetical protein B0A49_03910 [Cryomyces minteri]